MRVAESNRLHVQSCRFLEGKLHLPGDKSISHRAVILSSIAQGVSRVTGLQKGRDLLATLRCMQDLGVHIREEKEDVVVKGKGLRGLREPESVLDCENSGTTMRLLSGILAAQDFYSVLTGDTSLRKRPMQRITVPLCKMGAKIWAREGHLAPLSIQGGPLQGIRYTLPVASAQVKSSVLLAGLYAQGVTGVREPHPSRDHTERMLAYLGVRIDVHDGEITVPGGGELRAKPLFVPGDISAGAFFLGGAAVLEGSRIRLEKVGVNPTRCGFLEVLTSMGATITIYERRNICSEEIADVEVRGTGKLQGVKVGFPG